MVLHRRRYGIVVAADFPLKFHEYFDAAMLRPFDPSVQFLFRRGSILALEHEAQFLFQQIGPVQPFVRLGMNASCACCFGVGCSGAFPRVKRDLLKSLAAVSSFGASFRGHPRFFGDLSFASFSALRHAARRTSSRTSVAHWTTWNGSMQRSASGQ